MTVANQLNDDLEPRRTRWHWTSFWVGLLVGGIAALLLASILVTGTAFWVRSRTPPLPPEITDDASGDSGMEVVTTYLDRVAPGVTARDDFEWSSSSSGPIATVVTTWGSGSNAQAIGLVVNTTTRAVVATYSVGAEPAP